MVLDEQSRLLSPSLCVPFRQCTHGFVRGYKVASQRCTLLVLDFLFSSQAKHSVKEEPRPSSCPCFNRHSRAVWTFPETLDSAGSATAIVFIVTWLSETKNKASIHSWLGLIREAGAG